MAVAVGIAVAVALYVAVAMGFIGFVTESAPILADSVYKLIYLCLCCAIT